MKIFSLLNTSISDLQLRAGKLVLRRVLRER